MEDKFLNYALAFAPGHITGFFEICDNGADPLHKGSRGAGICINKGVKTLVRFIPAEKKLIKIRVNGKESSKLIVSLEIANMLLANQKNIKVYIDHTIEIPIGCGLGTSGAGALSLALSLNQVLNLGSVVKMAQIAHIAEIKCKTGLGTVAGQFTSGFELRKKPGAPGIGIVEKLKISSENYNVLCLVLKKMSTARLLINKQLKKRINQIGEVCFRRFYRAPTIDMFMTLSREFAESVGLITSNVQKILNATDKKGFLCSQAMFGETIFSVVKKSFVPDLLEIFRCYASKPYQIINAEIDTQGARILEVNNS